MLIYLSPNHARAFLDRIAESFPPQTTLFLGAAETIWQISDRLEAIPVRDTFIYRRKSTAPTSQAPPAADQPRVDRRVASRSRRRAVSIPRVDASGRRQSPTGPRAPASPRVAEPVTAANEPADIERLAAAGLLATAHAALDAGEHVAAIVAFRKCVYLAPHDPVAHLQLGLALEAAGQPASARRAYTAARGALVDGAAEEGHAGIKGFAPVELVRLLDLKLKVQMP